MMCCYDLEMAVVLPSLQVCLLYVVWKQVFLWLWWGFLVLASSRDCLLGFFAASGLFESLLAPVCLVACV